MQFRRLGKMIDSFLSMFVASGEFNLVCNRTRICDLLLAT